MVIERMIQSTIGSVSEFNKNLIAKIIERGNLETMYQRCDIYTLDQALEYPTRVCIKIGKVSSMDAPFINKENAQEYRTSNIIKIDSIIQALKRAKIDFLKKEKRINADNINWWIKQDVDMIVDIYRGR